jgi:hypothetical protein
MCIGISRLPLLILALVGSILSIVGVARKVGCRIKTWRWTIVEVGVDWVCIVFGIITVPRRKTGCTLFVIPAPCTGAMIGRAGSRCAVGLRGNRRVSLMRSIHANPARLGQARADPTKTCALRPRVTQEFLQFSHLRLVELYIPCPHESLRQSEWPEANTCETAHREIDRIEKPANLAVATLRKGYTVPVVSTIAAHILKAIEACLPVFETYPFEQSGMGVVVDATKNPYRVLALPAVARMH